MIKLIEDNGITYAKIIRAKYQKTNTEFFTQDEDEMQFGYLKCKKGYKTGSHYHYHNHENSNQVDEILMVQEGCVRVDFYNDKGVYLKSVELFDHDIIIIYKGGHNLVYKEDTSLYIIKSGKYDKDNDKIRIIGANNLELNIEND